MREKPFIDVSSGATLVILNVQINGDEKIQVASGTRDSLKSLIDNIFDAIIRKKKADDERSRAFFERR